MTEVAVEQQYESLTITNDFVFSRAMLNKDLCKHLLELILNIDIAHIEYPYEQKTISLKIDAKSIRLDVYVLDDTDAVYNIEMQVANTRNIPKRSRYYQGLIDLNLLNKGEVYNKLPKSFVIFILMEDIFHKDYCIYTFQNVCREDSSLILDDETFRIFVNPFGNKDGIKSELKCFLNYLSTGIAEDKFTRKLDNEVIKVRENKEWRKEYMTLLMRDNEMKEIGREEGRAEGRVEGLAKGRVEGLAKGRVEGLAEGRIQGRVELMTEMGIDREEIVNILQKKFILTKEQAEDYYNRFSRISV